MLARVLALAACYGAALVAASTSQGSPVLSTDTTAAGSGSGSGAVNESISVNQTRRVVGELSTVSGLPLWVDPTTPDDKQAYVTSRGETWELVMSDEFGDPRRNFTPGGDHLWTSLEKPDGVNGALEFYAHNMSKVICEAAKSENATTSTNTTAVCYLNIEVQDVISRIKVYNLYSRPPGYQYSKFYYRAAMLQSWNKFCFQGGMIEVRAQLPGAVTKASKNPDLAGGPNARVVTGQYYPTWPGIWMMGNLGRAIFSGSTNRMWPFSYNECNPKAFDPSSQRISACNENPGHGLNPKQGRGAPEIDLLEGGGVAISSSIQIGPGLKMKYRRIPANLSIPKEYKDCVYNADCLTPGANLPNVPTSLYKPRKYQTWYKGLRYSSNSYCAQDPKDIQTFAQINASITNIVGTKCTVETCPASHDVQADLSLIPNDKTKARWGINSKGTCAAVMNNYMGSFLCDPDSTNPLCEKPRNATTPKTNVMEPFAYQMDALSANWGIHVGAYTDFVTYQIEWVTGDDGYLRWMLFGNPIFEIPAETLVKGPHGPLTASDPNPRLTFPEEPMYIIFNVALSNQWGAMPPNAGKGACRGKGDNAEVNRICDSFPMHMKIDYVRLYQDKSPNSTMSIGCDPKSHPTRQWIFDHLEEYQDDANPYVEVDGGAYCCNDLDCMAPFNTTLNFATGSCFEFRCKCNTKYWGGPRCTTAIKITDFSATTVKKIPSYGPPLYLSITVGSISAVMTCVIIAFCTRRRRRKDAELQQKLDKMKADIIEKSALLPGDFDEIELSRHSNATPQSRYHPLSGKAA